MPREKNYHDTAPISVSPKTVFFDNIRDHQIGGNGDGIPLEVAEDLGFSTVPPPISPEKTTRATKAAVDTLDEKVSFEAFLSPKPHLDSILAEHTRDTNGAYHLFIINHLTGETLYHERSEEPINIDEKSLIEDIYLTALKRWEEEYALSYVLYKEHKKKSRDRAKKLAQAAARKRKN